jgi:hypothetical protein
MVTAVGEHVIDDVNREEGFSLGKSWKPFS